MYFQPNPSPRRDPAVTTSAIQKILDENVHLIHGIMTNQKAGTNTQDTQELQLLHKNLIYLATIADQATDNRSVVAGAVPPQQQRGGPPPPSGFPQQPPLADQHAFPPTAVAQSRGQPVPPNYMPPPPVGPGGAPMMPPQHQQHPGPPQQLASQAGPPMDDRMFMQQQQRVVQTPPYVYPPQMPPQPIPPSMPQQQLLQQQPPFAMSQGGDYGTPRYENPSQPMGNMSGVMDSTGGVPETQTVSSVPASIGAPPQPTNAPVPQNPVGGVVAGGMPPQQQQQPQSGAAVAVPSPNPSMIGNDQQSLLQQQSQQSGLDKQQATPPPPPSSTSSG